jgi:hypothetical protein
MHIARQFNWIIPVVLLRNYGERPTAFAILRANHYFYT